MFRVDEKGNVTPTHITIGDFYQELPLDSRFTRLCDRLQEYYLATPDSMTNKQALIHWKQFKEWCLAHGYTSEEINRAKQARMYKM